ncbi:sulfurtransferase [Thalassotalea sp. G2M2-11]|uniref:sulfurtransferase n=1 Tax=Thalassotalea sp. G2M2-11 TaxID=2787627 RepID=UPI0019CF6FD5|nr:sulfurtransferase [Thalassotalea sp. G2M2-11]
MPYSQLISPQSLKQILKQPNLVLLDASIPPVAGIPEPEHGWPQVTIQGARRFDLNDNFSDRHSEFSHTLPSVEQFQQSARALGINRDSQIVVYDNVGIYSAPRAWWMFKAMGHSNVAVLDGGLPNWLAQGYAVEPAQHMTIEQGDIHCSLEPQYFCDYRDVLKAIDDDDTTIIDARAENRFLGKTPEPRKGLRSGHIPNSKSLPFQTLISQGQLVEKAQLQQSFAEIAQTNQTLVFSCGSGITACVLALAADIAEFPNLRVYDGSWAEWGSNEQLPIS